MDFDSRCKNQSFAAVRWTSMVDRLGWDVAVAIAKMTYDVDRLGNVKLGYKIIRFADQYDDGGGLAFPSDLVEEKVGTDVGLVGTAYPPVDEDKSSMESSLVVGTLKKTIRVFGPRVYEQGAVGLTPGPARPLLPTPLRFDQAFGGRDPSDASEAAVERHNPVGVGHSVDPAKVIGRPAPLLEAVTALGARAPHPSHATFGPIPPHWQPRSGLAGTHDADWAKHRSPFRPKDFEVRHNSWSTPDLWLERPLVGNEPVEVRNVTDDHVWRFSLPLYGVQFFSVWDDETQQHPTHLDGFLIDADKQTVELTWRASIRLPRKWDRLKEIQVVGMGELPREVLGDPHETGSVHVAT